MEATKLTKKEVLEYLNNCKTFSVGLPNTNVRRIVVLNRSKFDEIAEKEPLAFYYVYEKDEFGNESFKSYIGDIPVK